MATQQVVNVGTQANDATGDLLRDAFTKTNANFTQLYAGGGNVGIIQNIQAGPYTLVLADAQGQVSKLGNSGASTWTIPANSSVAFPIGTYVQFVNLGTGNMSIAITSDTMTLIPGGTTGTRTLTTPGTATALKVAATSWIITGFNLT